MKRDFISILDFEKELEETIDVAINIKAKIKSGGEFQPLKGKHLGMIFEKPSLRTRVSFEIGFSHLGGTALYLAPNEIQVGKRESVHDVAKVISRYVDIIMYRAFSNKVMVELAQHADVPVINGLDDLEHPCQIMADLMTVKEHLHKLEGLKLTYLGDGNNVCNSLLLGCATVGMNMTVGCPSSYEPESGILQKAKDIATKKGMVIEVIDDPIKAVKDADVVYTDTWVSMGDEAELEQRKRVFPPFQVNADLASHANPNHIFLHCLPAHRNDEVTDEVLDGEHSKVFDQAENRMWAQMAVMLKLLAPKSVDTRVERIE
ncbi:MAG: ornithine carbamoyltransferase [Candidatus Proteinoplasmatales archaeon SG8-5]|nr:MAG: ornithine carbamoyltransferase [Candidatus Proteinoplasmatales archaeon SG8-5]